MCGFAGFLGRSGHTLEFASVVRRMNDRISHRGPDDSGMWIDSDAGFALGHRRLSVIDLSVHGHQPIVSRSGRYILAFNGEIYNFRSLRTELSGFGFMWRGHSDTEVMVEAFERWGVERSLRTFNGMFAFALWDRDDQTLHIGRDRFGEKPLYYSAGNGAFLFGSELKALAAHPDWRNDIDRGALDLYMRCNFVPTPQTIYANAKKLPAGSYLKIKRGSLGDTLLGEVTAYWSARDTAIDAHRRKFTNYSNTKAELRSLLENVICSRAEADVPLGAFLSGGIDSSLVVAVLQRHVQRPVQTFTIGYTEAQYDESKHAADVARYLGTEHICHIVSPNIVSDAIRDVPRIYDEPFADSSQIPTYLVSKLARTRITVSLTGDGGDELFGGYHRYFVGQNTWRRLKRIPTPLRSLAANMIQSLTPAQWRSLLGLLFKATSRSSRGALSGERLHRLAMALHCSSPAQMYAGLMTRHDDRTVIGLPKERYTSLYESNDCWIEHFDEAEAMMLIDTVGVLSDDFLVKVDRASMAVSLETRAPFLDPALFEFAWRLPTHWRISSQSGKIILRDILAEYMPLSLFDRPKQGFGIPIGEWLHGPLREWAENLLAERRLKEEGLLNPTHVRKAWNEHLSRTYNRQSYLWSVLVFQQWLEHQRAEEQALRAA